MSTTSASPHKAGTQKPAFGATDCRVCAAIRASLPALAVAAALSLAHNLLLLAVPLHLMQVFDRVLASRSLETLVSLTAIALFALVVAGVLDIARGRMLVDISAWLDRRLALGLFERAVQGPLRGQRYSTEAMNDLAIMRGFAGSPAMITLFDLPWTLVYIGAAFLLHPVFGYVALGTLAVLLATGMAAQTMLRGPARWTAEATMQVRRNVEAVSRNAETIEAMGMMQPIALGWLARHQASVARHCEAEYSVAWLLPVSRFIRLAAQVLIVSCGAWLAGRGEATAGAIIGAVFMLAMTVAAPERAIGIWKEALAARDAMLRLKGFALEPEYRPQMDMQLPAPEGALAVEAVVYGVPGAAAPILKGVSFQLAAGEGLAIIGASAAGKSTLARLLAGAVPASAGKVRLDGADIFAWDRQRLAPHIGYMPQDVQLFAGTVAENIARMQEADPQQVVAAAEMADAHQLILGLPAGYETQVGEDGHQLSAGHRQRIGLARALLGSPRLVILDEPNSNLDGDGEAALARALARIKLAGATVVLITHRPALLQQMDKVLILRDGAVQAFGPCNEVLGGKAAAAPQPAARNAQPAVHATAAREATVA